MRKEGGTLSVSLSSIELAESDIASSQLDLVLGNYIKLEVMDIGHGMDQITLKKVFDPFITTKELGEGTGLGLAVVHGIVKSCQGDVVIESELGKGTSINIFFPKF